MLTEAIEALLSQGANNSPRFIQHPGGPNHVAYVEKDGDLLPVPVVADNRPIEIVVNSIDDVIAIADNPAGVGIGVHIGVFVGASRVEVVSIGYDGPDECAFCSLDETAAFSWLADASNGLSMDTRSLRTMLRTTLRDCLPDEARESLVNKISKVDFNGRSRTSVDVSRDKESLGREVMEEAIGKGPGLPDEVTTLNVRVLSNYDIRATVPVRLLIDPMPAEQAWRVQAVESDIIDGRGLVWEDLLERIRSGVSNNKSANFYRGDWGRADG